MVPIDRHAPGPRSAVPVLRIFDVALAYEFYLEHLGFEIVFEHRFAPDLPLYARIARQGVTLDLSEHHGDGTPGSVVWFSTHDVDGFLAELRARPHPRLRPDIDRDAPGGPTLDVVDPFGNLLRFCGVGD